MAVTATDAELVGRAERLAAALLARAEQGRSGREGRQQRRIARLLEDRNGLSFTLALTDEVLRIRSPVRSARHLRRLVETIGSPDFLGPTDRLLLRAGLAATSVAPRLVMPLVAARLRAEVAGYVLPAESRPLGRHIAARRREGIRLNLNLLGEAVLGNDEAQRRLQAVIGLLRRPDVDYVSVKVSSVCAQLNPAAFDAEVTRVAVRMRELYDAAAATHPAKFVNLDMEEYRDLDLTVAVFRSVLSEPAYRHLDAGIVLQAYVPDSLPALVELAEWARARRRDGGGRIKVRIVKGANLAMERTEAELAGWEQAPFDTKADVDANYKRMLDVALDPANADALRVGVASHNLFELAWALTVAAERHVPGMVEVEMLEGMAGASAAPVRDASGGLLLYAPIVARSDHESAIAYLVRRFDENTGPDNFLRNQYSMRAGSATWEAERARFVSSVERRHLDPPGTRRRQDRSASPARTDPKAPFANEADTDLAVAANREWLRKTLASDPWSGDTLLPAVVAGETVCSPATGEGSDPSRPGRVAYRWVHSDLATVERAVEVAREAQQRWWALGVDRRAEVVHRAGDVLAERRGELIAAMARDGGKIFAEADPEVSEAIDFARYYAASARRLPDEFRPLGVVAVVPPWNFPLAIPAGGVLAALAAGNAVILKPAPETVGVAAALANACWDAGIPTDVLQFVPCADDDAGRRLVTHPEVDGVILTGAWETARMFLGWRPDLRLHAETSGKNAIVVTEAADLDRAVADIVHSAFGHAGQKCSAASLAIVEAGLHDDPRFLRQLADATTSLRPGPAWEPTTTIGPLIRPPEGPLLAALRHLEPGESWLVEPRSDPANPQLWSPGIKIGVAPGSPFHLTECFGPVLGVMRAADLDEAIRWQNQPAYGLTAGLHSLDPEEITTWLDRVEAGNLYVNRHITGAIVRRQPFGGWKRSVVGPGAKAGGPNYVASLGRLPTVEDADARVFGRRVRAVLETELAASDPSGLASEANVLRYRPLRRVLVLRGPGAELAVAAGEAVGVTVEVADDEATARAALGTGGWDKLRLLGDASPGLRLHATDLGVWVDDLPVAVPQAELLRWVREQAVSVTLHRHGNLTGRYDRVVAGL
jgi:RHH-type proline utilization regulon transcriptional repressor/proline dehydrogenase/delta 1-pyrroline-5-carboxylate dehydrogenase